MELENLTNRDRMSLAIDTDYFPYTAESSFWSSKPNANNFSGACYVDFSSGYTDYDAYRGTALRVRLVRSQQ